MPDPTLPDTALGVGKYVAGFATLAGALLLAARRIGSEIRKMGASDGLLVDIAKHTKDLQEELDRERKRREEEVGLERTRRLETEESLRRSELAATACGQRYAHLEGRMEAIQEQLADSIREHDRFREEIAELRRENTSLRSWVPADRDQPEAK